MYKKFTGITHVDAVDGKKYQHTECRNNNIIVSAADKTACYKHVLCHVMLPNITLQSNA